MNRAVQLLHVRERTLQRHLSIRRSLEAPAFLSFISQERPQPRPRDVFKVYLSVSGIVVGELYAPRPPIAAPANDPT